MKHIDLRSILLGLFILMTQQLSAQQITSVTHTPNPLDCNPLSVTIAGNLNCINYTVQGSSSSISGTTIFVNVNIQTSPICLPAIAPFSQTTNVGLVPSGTYTLMARTLDSGTGQVLNSNAQSITIGSCCNVDPGFAMDKNPICPGDSITFTANDTSYQTYSWKIDGLQVSTDSIFTHTFPAAGSFTVLLFADEGNCSDSMSQTITVGLPQITFVNVTDENCPNSMDGTATVQMGGGMAPFSYSWSTGDTTAMVSSFGAGTHLVTVTDSTGCSVSDSVTLSTGIDVTASFTVSDPGPFCPGDTVTFTSTSMGSPTSFDWKADGLSFGTASSASYVVGSTGSISISLLAFKNVCLDSVSSTITGLDGPAIASVITDATCPNTPDGDINLSISGGVPAYSFSWSTGDVTEDISGLALGSYSVSVTDMQTCTTVDSFVVGSGPGVDPGFTSSQTTICEGNTVTFTSNVSSYSNYDWAVDGSNFGSTAVASYTFPTAGSYDIRLITGDGTCSDTSVQTFVVPVSPAISIDTVFDESCTGANDGGINTTVTSGLPPYQYIWSTGNNTPNISNKPGGTYWVTVTDANGCKASDTTVINTGIDVIADFTASDPGPLCPGDTVDFTNSSIGSPTQYSWLADGQIYAQTVNSSYVFFNTGSVDIMLIVQKGVCNDTASMTVQVSDIPQITATVTDASCDSATDGSISLSVSGGVPSYNYSWSNGATGQSNIQLAPGPYAVQVTDNIGCEASGNYIVGAGVGVVASFTASQTNLICPGETVDFTNTSTGGTSLVWKVNGQFFGSGQTSSFTFTTGGNYQVSLVASEGECADSAQKTISVVITPFVAPTITDQSCDESNDGSIDLFLNGGVPPFSFLWSNGATTEDIGGLSNGIYSVEITDGGSCMTLDTFEIMTLGGLTAAFSHDTVVNDVQFTDLSDSSAVSWDWDFGDGSTSKLQNPVHAYQITGVYTVCLTATDQYGCQDSTCSTVDFVLNTTSIDHLDIGRLRLYPNPVEGIVVIEIPETIVGELTIELFDMMGRAVLSDSRAASSSIRVDLSGLPNGSYSIRVHSRDKIFVGKLLRQ